MKRKSYQWSLADWDGQNLAHGSFHVEDPKGRAWKSSRAFAWWGQELDPISVEVGHAHHAGLEWSIQHPHRAWVSLKVSTTGEETLDVHLGLLGVSTYWSYERRTPFGIKRLRPIRFSVRAWDGYLHFEGKTRWEGKTVNWWRWIKKIKRRLVETT